MSITLDLDGAPQLAASVARAASAVGDLTQVNHDAGALVLGAVQVPKRTGALAATVQAHADAAGVTLTAGGSTAPYAGFVHARRPFLYQAIDGQVDNITDTYLDGLTAAVEQITGA